MTASHETQPAELAGRLDFSLLDEAALARIAGLQPEVLKHLGPALDRFYERLAQDPAVSRFFGDSAQVGRAKSAQSGHWTKLASGDIDADYYESSRRIGLRHARIGLEPRWYIGGYGLIVEGIVRGVLTDRLGEMMERPRGLFGRGKKTEAKAEIEELADGLTALLKAVMLDIDIAVSVYFDELTEAAAATQKAAADKVALAVTETGAVLRRVAEGDLTARVTADLSPELEQIKHDTNTVADRLTAIMAQLRGTSRSLKAATAEIAAGANDLAERTTRQSASIQQTSTAMNEVAATVAKNASLADAASQRTAEVLGKAEQSGKVMAEATGAMDRITESSSRISGIVGLIDDIAFQTNLLALNASVEAARAGEAGRGFAVVAVEVRRLAQSAAAASQQIKQLIEASTVEVETGSGIVAAVAGKLAEIVDSVRQCNELTASIAEASRGQTASIREIGIAIREMEETTQHNAALVEQTNAAAEQTDGQAAELDQLVETFRIDGGMLRDGREKRRVA